MPVDQFGNEIVTTFEFAAATTIFAQYSYSVTPGRAQGYINTSTTSNQAVRATTYTPSSSSGQRSISSSSASDSSSGTGAQSVTINYLDSSFVQHSETIALNGTTAVPTVGTNYLYIESIVVTTVGTGGVNVGVISLYTNNNGTGTVIGSIAIGDQQTWWAHHYVPTGVTCYITCLSAGGTAVAGDINLIHMPSLATAGAPTTQVGLSIIHPAGGNWEHDFEVPIALAGPDFVWINEQPIATTANKTVAGFEYVQF
jgi:hypothetical protein